VERVARALCDSGVDEFHAYPLHELIEDLKINSDFEIWRLCESYGGRALLAETPPRSVLVQDAGKMQRLMQLLPPLVATGTKSLIFSQMTRMLDILEVVLQDANIAFVRLDGQTPINERMQLIDRFNNEPKLSIFLLSTRAGGLGINLTAATEVFFYDYGFNPQVERQAEDRCHRLGQEHQVTVTRLVLQKSIDENILQLATDKTRLNDMMLEEGKFVAAEEANHQRKLERSILQKILQQAE
jgi:SWI/SNF-related matrix-associated actin-dependent regulator 1 of chromatin subfamily A